MLRAFYHMIRKKFIEGNFGSEKWKKRFGSFGEGSVISFPANISGESEIFIGKNTKILSNSRLSNFYTEVVGGRESKSIRIGNRCWIGFHFTILNASSVIIGDDVLIASYVLISSENHSVNPESEIPYMHQPLITKPVTIGDGSWIGEKVCVLPGVSIGKKCVIGGCSVVTKSIPDYCMAVGNPARIIKKYNFNTHNWEIVI